MKKLDQVSVALLGPNIDHQSSLLSMLSGRAKHVALLPDSHNHAYQQATGFKASMRRKFEQLTQTGEPTYLRHLCELVDEACPEVVVAYWGTNPLPDVFALRKMRPGIKLVLMVLCYPQALNGLGIARQRWMMRRAAKVFDAFIFPSQEMADHFRELGLVSVNGPFGGVVRPCWPRFFQATERRPPVSGAPNLVFIGRTDLSHHTVHAADDVRPVLDGMLAAGIEVHHAWSKETDDGHPLRKPFKAMSQADLIAKMSGHDAALIVYNTEACARDDRFRFTVPDRLITSVASGVPIAIPSRGYDGIKSYLRDYPAILTFDSPGDLQEQLSDRSHVASLRDAAWAARDAYCAEGQGSDLQLLLERIC